MDQTFLLEINKIWREELTPADIAEREAKQAEFRKWMFFEDKEKVEKVKKEEKEWMKEYRALRAARNCKRTFHARDDSVSVEEDNANGATGTTTPPRKVVHLQSSPGSDASDTTLSVSSSGSGSSAATLVAKAPMKEALNTAFARVSGSVYARGGYVRHLPDPLDTVNSIADKPGVAFLFKPSGMDQLYRLFQCHRPILLRRPFGWGIEMFATSFIARIDTEQTIDFASLHAPESTSDSVCGVRQHSVLALDFHDLDADARTVKDVTDYMHQKCNAFLEFEGLRELPSRDNFVGGSAVVCEIFTCMVGMAPPFVVVLENFDALTEPELRMNDFFDDLAMFTRAGVIKALVLLSSKETSEPFPDHDHPKVPFGLQDVLDVTHHPAFQTAIGCTASDVCDLDDALAKTFPNAMGDIFELLRSKEVFPVSFVDPNWADIDSEDPLQEGELRTDGKDVGVYRFESVLDALNEKYELTTKNS
ncbi:hypothetical protein MKEN_00756800 [Mycena kentingensis (nom. inval.)]|nr:hypothetical protein MKEN_00756800 [Mycena kentingensis (nom. inval.)]